MSKKLLPSLLLVLATATGVSACGGSDGADGADGSDGTSVFVPGNDSDDTPVASGRSVEAYCSTMEEHKQRYLSEMDESAANLESGDAMQGFSGLIGAISAIGDLNRMWQDLAKVAPEDIQGDVEAVRDAWQKQSDNAAEDPMNPLKGALSSLATGLMNMGPMTRVDQWTIDNCS